MTEPEDPSASDPPEEDADAQPAAKSPRTLSHDDLAVLHQHLRELVEAKVPLPSGLKVLALDADGALRQVVEQLVAALEEGRPLAEAAASCGDAIPRIYIELLAAGEETGDLTGSLELLVHQAQVDAEIDARVRDALVYPSVTLAFVVLAGAGALAVVSSAYRELFASMGVSLPWLTQALLDAGEYARVGFLPLLVVCVVLAGLAPRWLKRVGRILVWPLVVPQLQLRNLGGFARALAGFLGRGVPAVAAVGAIARTCGDLFPDHVLRSVGARLEGGESLADALRAEPRAFPPTFVWALAIAEERGSLPETLLDLARRHEDLFRRRVLVLTGFLTPVLLIGLGLLVGLSFLAVFQPMLQVVSVF